MEIDDKIRDKKLQYDINRKAAIISALLPGKTDKYEYVTGQELLPFDQSSLNELDNFTSSPSGKALKTK